MLHSIENKPPLAEAGTRLRHRLGIVVRLLIALAVIMAGPTVAQSGPPRPVALTGTDGEFGPGLGAAVEFAAFEADGYSEASPAINARGGVVFIATLSGDGVTADNDTGIWVYRRGVLSLVAREGQQVPGMASGVVYSKFGDSSSSYDGPFDPHISDTGRVAFKCELRGTGIDSTNDGALLAERDGTVSLVLQERATELPGHSGIFLGQRASDGIFGWQPIHMTRDGQIIMKIGANGYVSGGGFREWATIKETNGAIETWFYYGDPVPGFPEAVFTGAFFDLEVSRDGYIADSRLNTEVATVGFDHALWSDRSGALEPIYPQGTPQYPDGGGAYLQAINSLGRLAVYTSVDEWEDVLWSEGMYGIALTIAEMGGAAPGTQSVFDSADGHTVLADSGTLALNAFLAHDAYTNGSNDRGVWINRSGTLLELELRKGDPVPSRPDRLIADLNQIYINASDRIAVVGQANDNQSVLWLRDDTGGYQVIAKGIDPDHEFDVFGDGSDMRLIVSILSDPTSGSTGDARRNVINDRGEIVFRLTFLDASEGIFSTAALAGDIDGDGDVDIDDFSVFRDCMSGPNVTPNPPAPITLEQCLAAFDFDGDGDVDLGDFARFQTAFTGT